MTQPTPRPYSIAPAIGDRVKLRFGSSGTQIAVICKITRPRGTLYGHKWSARAQCWRGPIRIYPDEIIGPATPEDIRKCGIYPHAPIKPSR